MTDSQYIGYKLKNDATIQGYVGSGSSARVFHGFVPETVTAYPVINYFVISYQNFDTCQYGKNSRTDKTSVPR